MSQSAAAVSPAREELDAVKKVMFFKFDPVLYVESPEYTERYSNKIIYFILEVVNANSGITVNQVCSLLRNTLQIPEELTRSTLLSLIKMGNKVFKTYESSKDIKHLQLASGYFSLQKQISEQEQELLQYEAPIYQRKKKEDNPGVVSTP